LVKWGESQFAALDDADKPERGVADILAPIMSVVRFPTMR